MSCPVSNILTSAYKFRFQTQLDCFTCSLLSVQNLFMLPLLLSCKCCLLNSSFPYTSSYCFFLCHQDSHCQGRCWLESGQWETKCAGLSHLPYHACSLIVLRSKWPILYWLMQVNNTIPFVQEELSLVHSSWRQQWCSVPSTI